MKLETYLKENSLSQKAFGESIGSSQSAVTHWINGRYKVPPEKWLAIEKVTDGQVTRADLRPDLFLEQGAA